jgi:hypothetical protein
MGLTDEEKDAKGAEMAAIAMEAVKAKTSRLATRP